MDGVLVRHADERGQDLERHGDEHVAVVVIAAGQRG